ncbi:hypothetical protein CDL15_Pgr005088 [Punica granatum]|uniref:Uncharacterized protein n=1 Tax=Punica granatum TaxID=22663 RepID=A0A218WXH5_PUNGR|nr:hypothetical protein CDL15_Pgr005088 [Punica granatum]PKI79462.1 hypothetical protein CRG98_000153 [Punica granatum]
MNGSRTVTASSRRRRRVVRNPSNVTARLAEVAGGNGTREGSDAPKNPCSRCFGLLAGTTCWRPQMFKLCSEMGLGGGNVWDMKFGCDWLKSGWVVTGKPGGFPSVLAGFDFGVSWMMVGR